MPWQAVIALDILIKNIMGSWLLKKVLGFPSRYLRFFIMYLFAAVLSSIIALNFGQLIFDRTTFFLTLLGLANGFAAYCLWRAVDISLSRNSLFSFWPSLIAMFLAYFLLNEQSLLNTRLMLGIILSLISIILFTFSPNSREKTPNSYGQRRGTFFLYVLAYSFLWGVAIFLMKYFALEKISTARFLFGWYSGAFMAATILLLASRDWLVSWQTIPGWGKRLNFISWSGALSLIIMASLGLEYQAYRLAPLVVVQPILLIAEMVLPFFVGFYIFSERRDFRRAQWLYFAIGLLGGILIALNF